MPEMVTIMKLIIFLQFFFLFIIEQASTYGIPLEIDNFACRPEILRVGLQKNSKILPIELYSKHA